MSKQDWEKIVRFYFEFKQVSTKVIIYAPIHLFIYPIGFPQTLRTGPTVQKSFFTPFKWSREEIKYSMTLSFSYWWFSHTIFLLWGILLCFGVASRLPCGPPFGSVSMEKITYAHLLPEWSVHLRDHFWPTGRLKSRTSRQKVVPFWFSRFSKKRLSPRGSRRYPICFLLGGASAQQEADWNHP